jgi:BASS family bile acid:Na+ symporter
VVAGTIARCAMQDTSTFVTVALPVALALIMGTLGLSLTTADFRRVAVAPRGVAIGLANLLAVSPLLAFAVAELFGLDPIFAVGLVVLGAAPGGTMANLLTHLARGDTALSVSMTALSSLAAVITVPLYLAAAIAHFDASIDGDVSMAGVVARVFAITIVPLAIGMRVRARRAEWAIANEPRIKRIAFVAFVFVVVAAVASEWGTVTEHFAELAIAALTLNVAAMSVSFAVSRLARLSDRQATAVSLELGLHNSTLAIAVGTLVADEVAIPAAVYSAFMFLTAGAFARLMYARNAATDAPATAGSNCEPAPRAISATASGGDQAAL